jgi:tetratricopeptide (TPR) repeat protein
VTAWLAGETLRLAPGRAWIGVAVTAGVMLPALQWLAMCTDPGRGLARVSAFISEPPVRTPAERAKTWDYIGIVHYRREHWNEAAVAFAHAAETGPSDRIMLEWAEATTNTGDLQGAADIYTRALARNADLAYGWLGLAAVSSRLAEAAPPGPERDARVAGSRRAAHTVLKLEPGNGIALQLLAYLERQYGAARDAP